MTDTELRKLGRRELLQLLLEQGRELEALKALLESTQAQLRSREIYINRSNSYVLPETGGAGTARLAVAGTVLMALAALTYLSLRRKGAEKP